MIVNEQPGPQDPGGAKSRMHRQNEAQRPDDVRRGRQQDLPFRQALPHQPELVLLQVSQPAMHQLRGGRRGCAGEVVLLDEQDRKTASRGIAGNANTIDSTPDDQQVERGCSDIDQKYSLEYGHPASLPRE